jgi:hypothetical protein
MMRMHRAYLFFTAITLSLLIMQPAMAAPPAQMFFTFTIDKYDVVKDKPIVARYQLTKPAKRVFITATDVEGGPLSFTFPQTSTVNALRTAGVITFTVPVSAGTLSPLRMMLNVDGQLRGLHMLRVACDVPWFFEPHPDGGCLFSPPSETPAAIQRFERGVMIWLGITTSIHVLQVPSGLVDRYDDLFVEGTMESDTGIAPPAGKLQPIRGFGLVWRSNPSIMRALGWAIEPERGYTACTGQTFGGTRNMRTYFTTPENQVVKVTTNNKPFSWQFLYVEKLNACK